MICWQCAVIILLIVSILRYNYRGKGPNYCMQLLTATWQLKVPLMDITFGSVLHIHNEHSSEHANTQSRLRRDNFIVHKRGGQYKSKRAMPVIGWVSNRMCLLCEHVDCTMFG